jgi:hypothetical protein
MHGTAGGNSTSMMIPWLHFTPGDTLLFQNWVPTERGPIFGACFGLFMLAILDRWLAALRRFMEAWWSEQFVLCFALHQSANTFDRARVIVARRFVQLDEQTPSEEDKNGTSSEVRSSSGSRRLPPLSRHRIPPFIASHDLARGAFVVFQTAITYALMLTVM